MTETKENPGCLCDLRKYLSAKTGIPIQRYVWKSPDEIRQSQGRRKWKYKMSQMAFFLTGHPQPYRPKNREMLKGGGEVQILETANMGLLRETIPVSYDRVLILEWTPLKDYDVPWENVGRYKDYSKGGWYSMIPLIRIDDHYFAPSMETTCCGWSPYMELSAIPRDLWWIEHEKLNASNDTPGKPD